MLTVRVIYPDGVERVFEALEVRKSIQISDDKTKDPYEYLTCVKDKTNEITEIFDEGEFYVMNEQAKTLANYIFGERKTENIIK